MTGVQLVPWGRPRARVMAPVEDDPEVSKASCLLGCGISDKPATLSDPWVSLYEKQVVLAG